MIMTQETPFGVWMLCSFMVPETLRYYLTIFISIYIYAMVLQFT